MLDQFRRVGKYLARVEDSQRVERRLDRPHRRDLRRLQRERQEAPLHQADAVFAGDLAAEPDDGAEELLFGAVAALDPELRGELAAQQVDVQVAVASVAVADRR